MSVFRLGNELVSYLWQFNDARKPFILGRAGVTYADKNYVVDLDRISGEHCYQYVISGEGYLWVDGKEYTVKKGDVFYLPKSRTHKYTVNPDNPMIKIFFCFQGSLAQKILDEYQVDDIIKCENLDLYEDFREIFNISYNRKMGLQAINDMSAQVFLRIVQKISCHEKVFAKGRREVYLLKEYLEANLTKSITLQDMANHICLSKSQTIRIFKEHFGVSPYEFFVDNKMAYAADLLKNSEKPIKQIAFELGFEDENYFSRVFKQKFNLSPRMYRGEIRNA